MGRLKQYASDYLRSKGLTPEDAAGVITTFTAFKYLTLLSFVPLCHKLQPLRRLVVKPSETFLQRIKSGLESRRHRDAEIIIPQKLVVYVTHFTFLR